MTAPTRRILVVDDEALIAMIVEDMLHEMGCEVVGPVGTNAEALALIDTAGIDAALVDINLRDGPSDPVARALRTQGIPFACVTGMAGPLAGAFADVPMLQKPFGTAQFDRIIALLVASSPPQLSNTG